MLSVQIDHLRELADALDGRYGYQGYEIAMRDAADTICELRGALHVASVDYRHLADENTKLRELLQRALTSHDRMCTQLGNCFGCPFFDAKPFAPACPIVGVTQDARKLGVEVPDGD